MIAIIPIQCIFYRGDSITSTFWTQAEHRVEGIILDPREIPQDQPAALLGRYGAASRYYPQNGGIRFMRNHIRCQYYVPQYETRFG